MLHLLTHARLSLWFLAFLLSVAAWRKVTKRSCVQEGVHRLLGGSAVVVQWYTVFFVGIVGFAAAAVFVFLLDYVTVPQREVDERLRMVYDNSDLPDRTFDDFREQLTIPAWLSFLNIFAHLAGLVVIGISMYHCWALLIIPSQAAARKDVLWRAYYWHVPKRINWLLWIIVLPAVFCIEMLIANISVWGIVIGSAPEYQYAGFRPAQRLEILYVHEDIQVATIIQFTAIYAFTRLIGSLYDTTAMIKGHADEKLMRLAKEYKRLLRIGGFLGIWLYIIMGIVRAVIVIGISLWLHFTLAQSYDIKNGRVQFLEDLEEAFIGMIGITFTVLTILSVLNMVIMTRTFVISERLGDRSQGEYDANQKFMGARVLLICSEVVPKVIDVFEKGTTMHEQTKKVTQYVSFLYVNTEHAELLKITILNIACLVAVVMNYVFWKDLDLKHSGLLDFPKIDEPPSGDDDDDEPRESVDDAPFLDDARRRASVP